MVDGPRCSAETVGMLNYFSIFVFRITDCINTLVRYSIRVIKAYFLNMPIFKRKGFYMFCNSENLLLRGIESEKKVLLINKLFVVDNLNCCRCILECHIFLNMRVALKLILRLMN